MKAIVCIAGPVYSGKSEFACACASATEDVQVVSWSGIICRRIEALRLATSREEITREGLRAFETYGLEFPASWFLEELDTLPLSDNTVIIAEALRTPEQWQFLRRVAPCPLGLIYIDAPFEARWHRGRDQARFAEDAEMSLADFWWREQSHMMEARIPLLREHADLYCRNEATVETWRATAPNILNDALWLTSSPY